MEHWINWHLSICNSIGIAKYLFNANASHTKKVFGGGGYSRGLAIYLDTSFWNIFTDTRVEILRSGGQTKPDRDLTKRKPSITAIIYSPNISQGNPKLNNVTDRGLSNFASEMWEI